MDVNCLGKVVHKPQHAFLLLWHASDFLKSSALTEEYWVCIYSEKKTESCKLSVNRVILLSITDSSYHFSDLDYR